MPAQRYSQYFDIDEKYYAVVTKQLIDEGKVKWEGFYPHETFIQLLHQVTDMLSGKENKSIWVEGTYGTGKSHAALTVKCLLEAPDEAVRAYFKDYGLNDVLCDKFLNARSEEVNGKLLVIHRIGSSNIKNDDDLVWAVQSSVSVALKEAGIHNAANGTLKEAFIDWVNAKAANKQYLSALIAEKPMVFRGMNLDTIIAKLNSEDDVAVDALMEKLITLGRESRMDFLSMDAEKLSKWICDVIAANNIGAIVFIWDEFSEYFKNCQNSLTGFQTLTHISFTSPFYFMIVTHESDGLIASTDRKKITNRFFEPKVKIELPDNMAFQLMAQAMKPTTDPVMLSEWQKVKASLNSHLTEVRKRITEGAKKHAKAGSKTLLSDEDLQKIVPLHPYAALILKHISRVFTSSQRSMFDFIIARDPDAEGKADSDALNCRAFKWFINHHGAGNKDNLMTIDMLWDFFNARAGGNMNPDALEILNNYDMLASEFHLIEDEQRVLKTVLLMNAICTRVTEADMLMPTYENIDLAFLGTGWPQGKAMSIARGLVHRTPPLQPVLFEEPMQDGTMRVIPKATGGIDIEELKKSIRNQVSIKNLVEDTGFAAALKVTDCLMGHFSSSMLYVNINSPTTYTNGLKEAKNKALHNPNGFELCFIFAMNDAERTEAGNKVKQTIREGIPENLILVDATTNTFATYLDTYLTNKAYAEYYTKSDKQQAKQFAAYALKNLTSWKDQVVSGEFRIYTASNPNGQMRMGRDALNEALIAINTKVYPFGIEQYNVNPTMFLKSAMGQGAEYGLTQVEKGAFSTGNQEKRIATALKDAWMVPGEYWKDPTKQGSIIVQIKREVERVIAEGFEKNGRVKVMDILAALSEKPFGFTPSNLSAYVLGFVLKEYANEQYFWSNGSTRPMTVELLKSAIKNAMDQVSTPKGNYRPEEIVTMSEKVRGFLTGTATIFHEAGERCGSVDAAAGIIRLGMKKLDFPVWVVKSLLDRESLQTDKSIVTDVIDRYLGIANVSNYAVATSESDLADEIGRLFNENAGLVADLSSLFTSQKCREGMKVYLDQYRDGELPALAAKIKDEGSYISEVKKKFNADEANWVWSSETANLKIDEVITEYSIVLESNTIIPQATSLAGCVRSWKDRLGNFRISLEAMAPEIADLKELLDILFEIGQSKDHIIPDMKKTKFLVLLQTKKNDYVNLYGHQEEIFKKIAASWLNGFSDEDISELFANYLETGVFYMTSEKYFQNVETKITAYSDAQRSKLLSKLWNEKTNTKNPFDWSRIYNTPILCMFEDQNRMKAREIFTILMKSKPTEAEFQRAVSWLQTASFYERISSQEERDYCFTKRVIGDYALLLPNVEEVREYLRDRASAVSPYDWMDNSIVQVRIKEKANMKYKTGGASQAEQAVVNLSIDELREYVRNLIKEDMTVGIAVLKKQKK